MKGLILSGGKGTRLYPLTYTLAKQLVPLANKPVLVRVIETIRDAGVTDIGIVVGDPTADEIMHRIGNGDAFGVKLTYIKQPSLMASRMRSRFRSRSWVTTVSSCSSATTASKAGSTP